jgi:diaminopimelate epimerase
MESSIKAKELPCRKEKFTLSVSINKKVCCDCTHKENIHVVAFIERTAVEPFIKTRL